MSHHKFSGFFKEIIEQYPQIDIAGFLSEKLQIPLDKAEELAARIEKEFDLKEIKAEPNLEKTEELETSPKTSVYSVESLSEMELEHFTKWLLEELNYEILPEKYPVDLGVNFVVAKDGEKIAIYVKSYPTTNRAPNSIVLKSSESKRACECQRALVVSSAYFSQQARLDAEALGVELLDRDTLASKIVEVIRKAECEVQSCFPLYKGSLLQSLLGLEETKDFIIEARADEKYDLHLPGVKYPLLTFQSCSGEVVRCVFRIKFNEPVGEFGGEVLIGCDRANNRFGPDGAEAYGLIIQYLEQFVE